MEREEQIGCWIPATFAISTTTNWRTGKTGETSSMLNTSRKLSIEKMAEETEELYQELLKAKFTK